MRWAFRIEKVGSPNRWVIAERKQLKFPRSDSDFIEGTYRLN
jgi:hypothetical protein